MEKTNLKEIMETVSKENMLMFKEMMRDHRDQMEEILGVFVGKLQQSNPRPVVKRQRHEQSDPFSYRTRRPKPMDRNYDQKRNIYRLSFTTEYMGKEYSGFDELIEVFNKYSRNKDIDFVKYDRRTRSGFAAIKTKEEYNFFIDEKKSILEKENIYLEN